MVDRRLAPILVADIIGFSRLVETDETFALEAANSTRSEVVDPAVSQHR